MKLDHYRPVPHRAAFGFPIVFPLAKFIAAPRPVWTAVVQPELAAAVTLHYDANRYAIQHMFAAGRLIDTRMMQFTHTVEDELLRPLDSSRGFGGSTLRKR